MRCAAIFAFFLLLAPLALGEITVEISQESLNFGDQIEVSASAVSGVSMSGFMRFTARCGSFSLPYYLTPVDLQAGFRSQLNAPALKALPSMEGQCAIEVDLLDEESEIVEDALSASFSVSDGLRIIILTENLSTLPGTSKKIEGIVRGAGDKTVNADIEFWYDDESYQTSTFNGKFIVILTIPSMAKSGAHAIKVAAIDEKMNQGSQNEEISVIAVPTNLEVALGEGQQDPGKDISYSITITDQAGDIIAKEAEASIVSADGTYLFRGTSESGASGTYTLGQFLAPGEYSFNAAYEHLFASEPFTINEVKDIRVSMEGDAIIVENMGNVPYKEEARITAKGQEKTYVVKKNLDLEPGQVERILLSKELPGGNYDIQVPSGMKAGSQDNSTIGTSLLAQNVAVSDERSSIKKIGSGLGSMTGAVIGADGLITRNPWYAPILLFSIIGLIGLYYTRGLWAFMFFGRR